MARPPSLPHTVPGTAFVVDYFSTTSTRSFFLSHYHSDHTAGLRRSFCNATIYCSEITKRFLTRVHHIDTTWVHALPMNAPVCIENVSVTLLDANHCPGSVMFLFQIPKGPTILHTGDFRYDPLSMKLSLPPLDLLFLDTTYCNPRYSFPPQKKAIEFILNIVKERAHDPSVLFVVGAYSIGKERVFMRIAERFGFRVFADENKLSLLRMSDLPSAHLLTEDAESARVHVVPLGDCALGRLPELAKTRPASFRSLVAFRPTGWTFSPSKPFTKAVNGMHVSYGIPYSEHSSFEELRAFAQAYKSEQIIPTVNPAKHCDLHRILFEPSRPSMSILPFLVPTSASPPSAARKEPESLPPPPNPKEEVAGAREETREKTSDSSSSLHSVTATKKQKKSSRTPWTFGALWRSPI